MPPSLSQSNKGFPFKHPPWQILTKDRKGEIVDASGVIFQMLDEISYLLNFTYNVREPEDGSWETMIQKVGRYSISVPQKEEKV